MREEQWPPRRPGDAGAAHHSRRGEGNFCRARYFSWVTPRPVCAVPDGLNLAARSQIIFRSDMADARP
jgi:hypothetical protein